METIHRARFDGKVFVPLDVVDLPVGEVLTFRREQSPLNLIGPKTDLQRLAEKLASYPPVTDVPTDLSAQHDHYLYGTPKRDDA